MTIRVVLVDDHENLRRLTRLWIDADERFEVVGEAGTGTEAIAVVTEQQPDVVLLDVAMPGMDGVSAVPFVRTAARKAKVVLYTGHREYGKLGLRKGAHALLEKGEPMNAVLDAIEELARTPE